MIKQDFKTFKYTDTVSKGNQLRQMDARLRELSLEDKSFNDLFELLGRYYRKEDNSFYVEVFVNGEWYEYDIYEIHNDSNIPIYQRHDKEASIIYSNIIDIEKKDLLKKPTIKYYGNEGFQTKTITIGNDILTAISKTGISRSKYLDIVARKDLIERGLL